MGVSVCSIMCTAGRQYLAKRALTYFINQDYKGKHTLLIYNNADVPLSLELPENLPEEKTIILINNHISKETGKFYTNLGEIYRDAILYLPEDVNLINFSDDDDMYLSNHITEGVKGYLKAKKQGKIAYKPAKSYFKHAGGLDLSSNTLEPSIFVEASHIKKYGFSSTTTEQHLQWVNPLKEQNKILVDEEGIPTLVYDWSGPVPTFKTSGDFTNPDNFNNYRAFSKQYGDKVLRILPKEEMDKWAINTEVVNG